MTEWQPPQTAPRDQTFIANVGLPYAVIAMWNEPSQEYVFTELQVDLYHGHWNDTYFENDRIGPAKLIAWRPLPEIKK